MGNRFLESLAELRQQQAEAKKAEKEKTARLGAMRFLPFGGKEVFNGKTDVRIQDAAVFVHTADSPADA